MSGFFLVDCDGMVSWVGEVLVGGATIVVGELLVGGATIVVGELLVGGATIVIGGGVPVFFRVKKTTEI